MIDGVPRIDFGDWHSPAFGDILDAFVAFGDDSHSLGNGLGRDRVVPCHHDDLDAGRATLGHGIRHCRPRWVDHSHEADEPQSRQWEVLVVGIEGKAPRELIVRQEVVAEAEHALPEAAQLVVGLFEGVLPLRRQRQLIAVHEDRGTAVEDTLRSSLHRQQVTRFLWIVQLVNRNL